MTLQEYLIGKLIEMDLITSDEACKMIPTILVPQTVHGQSLLVSHCLQWNPSSYMSAKLLSPLGKDGIGISCTCQTSRIHYKLRFRRRKIFCIRDC